MDATASSPLLEFIYVLFWICTAFALLIKSVAFQGDVFSLGGFFLLCIAISGIFTAFITVEVAIVVAILGFILMACGYDPSHVQAFDYNSTTTVANTISTHVSLGFANFIPL